MAAVETGQVLVHRRGQAHHRVARATAGTRVPIRPIRRSVRRSRRRICHRRAPIRTNAISSAARTPRIGSAMSHRRRRRRSCDAPFATHAAQRSSEPAIDEGIAGEMSVDMRGSPGKSFGEGCRNGGAQKSRSTDHTRSPTRRGIFRCEPRRPNHAGWAEGNRHHLGPCHAHSRCCSSSFVGWRLPRPLRSSRSSSSCRLPRRQPMEWSSGRRSRF